MHTFLSPGLFAAFKAATGVEPACGPPVQINFHAMFVDLGVVQGDALVFEGLPRSRWQGDTPAVAVRVQRGVATATTAGLSASNILLLLRCVVMLLVVCCRGGSVGAAIDGLSTACIKRAVLHVTQPATLSVTGAAT